MPIINLGQQRKIVRSILIKYVIFYDHHLNFFHIKSSVHLNRAFIDKVNYWTLALLR